MDMYLREVKTEKIKKMLKETKIGDNMKNFLIFMYQLGYEHGYEDGKLHNLK